MHPLDILVNISRASYWPNVKDTLQIKRLSIISRISVSQLLSVNNCVICSVIRTCTFLLILRVNAGDC